MLTLFDGDATTITLPDSMEWVDEYDWTDVKQDIQPTVGGSLVVSESVVSAGRPITLVSGDNVWITKDVIDALLALVNTVDKTYTLTLPDARTFTVMVNRGSLPLVAKPIFRRITQANDAYYTLTLRLMEI